MSHRPTFNPAVAAASFGYGGTKLSVKDQAAHTKLKYRQQGQSSQQEMKAYNMKIELERREAALKNEKQLAIAMVEREEKEVIKESVPALEQPLKHDFHDADIDFGDSEDSEDSISNGESDDDDDEEAELQRELEKIKAERLAAAQKKEEEERQLQEDKIRESALRGNPLMTDDVEDAQSFKVKRRWNDDVVFRNQASTEPEHKKRFINDTIRNDFHRSFLKKYFQ